MKLKCLLVEDEPLAHEVILKYIEDITFLEVVGQAYDAMTALNLLQERAVDLIFLDIRMPKIQGLDFLRILKTRPLVIITSAYEAHALESYELEVCDYLLKPFRFDRFMKAATKALDLYKLRQVPHSTIPAAEITPQVQPHQLFIRSDKRLLQVDLREIHYLESYGNYVKVWKQQEFFLTPQTLTHMESLLPEPDFLRIHKSYIVNRQHILYVEGNMVVLKDKKTLPLGKNYRQLFRDK